MKNVSRAVLSAVALILATQSIASEKYLKAADAEANLPWELIDVSGEQVMRVELGTPRNDDPGYKETSSTFSSSKTQHVRRASYRTSSRKSDAVISSGDGGTNFRHAGAPQVMRITHRKRTDNSSREKSTNTGEIIFRVPAGELPANKIHYLWLDHRSTNYGNDSIYIASDEGEFVKLDLPSGSDFQWFNTGLSLLSNDDGSIEIVGKNRESGLELKRVLITEDADFASADDDSTPFVKPPESDPVVTPRQPDPIIAPPGDDDSTPRQPDPIISPPGDDDSTPIVKPPESDSVVTPTDPGPVITSPFGDVAGVRQYSAIGTKSWRRDAFDKPKRGWATTEWNRYMAGAVREFPCAFSEHYPAIATRIKWKDAYVDSNIKPNREQARDPKWSNYIWNKEGSPGDDAVYDGITDALNSPQIDNGNGPGKLMIIVALTMTTVHDAPPNWMREDSTLAWDAKSSANGVFPNPWHVRFDNPTAIDHASDFMAALLAKYGNNKGIQSIQIGEYYLGPKDTRPSDLNRDRYWQGMRRLWQQSVASAPIDENGTRVHLSQVSPIFEGGVSLEDLGHAGFGASQSDLYMNLPVEGSPSEKMLDAYKSDIFTQYDADARYACIERRQKWDGTENPFGHKKGHSAVVTPQEYFWYHSERGPVPADSLFMTIAPNSERCKGAVQTQDNWMDAIATFGRCGSQSDRYGGSPASL